MKGFFNKVESKFTDVKRKSSTSGTGIGRKQDDRTLPQAILAPERGYLGPPTATDIYRYRYHHGVNVGSIFVLEKWLWPTLFEDGAKGGSELDAAEYQVSKYGLLVAKQHFEAFWESQTVAKEWQWLWTWLQAAGITSIRLPIGYFTLGPAFCKSTPFEKVSQIYEHAWNYVKGFVKLAASMGIGVLLDFHAVPGGANRDDHSGTSSHKAELWTNKMYMAMAKNCLEHIAHECAHREALKENVIGIQLCNEAVNLAPSMYDFYDMVREAIYQYNPDIPLYISDAWDLTSALQYAKRINAQNMNPVIVDTHKYYCFSDKDKKCTPAQIMDRVDIAEVPQGSSDSLVVGEYSCVMDGQTWGQISDDERAEFVRKFGNRQSQVWQAKTAGCFFWTLRMAWFPGGEWGFKEQNDKSAIIPPQHYNDDAATIKVRVQQAQAARTNLRSRALSTHVTYWNDAATGEQMEHFRFADGWNLGYTDAIAFYSFRSTLSNTTRTGTDKLGLVHIWSARRFAEYQAAQQGKSNPYGIKYLWEWQHGFKQGLDAFQQFLA